MVDCYFPLHRFLLTPAEKRRAKRAEKVARRLWQCQVAASLVLAWWFWRVPMVVLESGEFVGGLLRFRLGGGDSCMRACGVLFAWVGTIEM